MNLGRWASSSGYLKHSVHGLRVVPPSALYSDGLWRDSEVSVGDRVMIGEEELA